MPNASDTFASELWAGLVGLYPLRPPLIGSLAFWQASQGSQLTADSAGQTSLQAECSGPK